MEDYATFNNLTQENANYFIKEATKKRYVLDTSVVAKLYYEKDEEDISNAFSLYDILKTQNHIFFSPDLLVYELLNVYRAKHELDDDKINKIITELYDLIVIIGVNKNTFYKSFIAARNLGISFYDSVYLTMAGDLDATLITADGKLYEAAKDMRINILKLSEFIR